MDDGDDRDERFERRLVEETSKLRVDLAAVETRLLDRMAQVDVRMAQLEVRIGQGDVRMAQLEVRLTDRIALTETALRKDMNGLFRWAFAFWVGQFAALAALIVAFR